jgi:hypothetical protein
MSEVILKQDWLPQVELAFEKLKAACTAERKEFCEVIREDHGPEAEAELKAKLAAHDQAMAAKLKLIESEESKIIEGGPEAVKVRSTAPWRRDLKPRLEPETPPELSTILDKLKKKKPEGFFKNHGGTTRSRRG